MGKTQLSVGMRLIYRLQKRGFIGRLHEKSLLCRLLRANSLLKDRRSTQQIHPSPVRLALEVLQGKTRHTLLLPNPVTLHIFPTNLVYLTQLYGKLPLVEVRPESCQLIWEIAPGMRLPTRTDRGLDLFTLYEVFVEKIYGTNYQGKRVLDIGAYRGETTLFFLLSGAKEVVAVEPLPENAAHIHSLLGSSRFAHQVQVHAIAIGGSQGETHFLVTEESVGNRAISSAENLPLSERLLKVPLWRFSDLLEKVGWHKVDVVKLDCEGCEYSLLETTSDTDLQRVDVWIMEFHQGGARIKNRLSQLGYIVEWEERPDGVGTLRARKPECAFP